MDVDKHNLEMTVTLDHINYRWDSAQKKHTEKPDNYVFNVALSRSPSVNMAGKQTVFLDDVEATFNGVIRELKKRKAIDNDVIADIKLPSYWAFNPPTDLEDLLLETGKVGDYFERIILAIKKLGHARFALIGIGGMYEDVYDEEKAWGSPVIPEIKKIGL